MGGATNICSDKTGTLTMNQMTVMQGWIGGLSFDKVPMPSDFRLDDSVWDNLRVGIAVNTTALRQKDKDNDKGKVIGFPTEMALLDFVDTVDGTSSYYTKMRKDYDEEFVTQVPFSSQKKRMTTVYYIKKTDVLRAYVKGAPDQLIAASSQVLTNSGSLVPCDEDLKEEMMQVVKNLSNAGFRTLLLGYTDTPAQKFLKNPDGRNAKERYAVEVEESGLDTNITAVAIFGIEDPVRPGESFCSA